MIPRSEVMVWCLEIRDGGRCEEKSQWGSKRNPNQPVKRNPNQAVKRNPNGRGNRASPCITAPCNHFVENMIWVFFSGQIWLAENLMHWTCSRITKSTQSARIQKILNRSHEKSWYRSAHNGLICETYAWHNFAPKLYWSVSNLYKWEMKNLWCWQWWQGLLWW